MSVHIDDLPAMTGVSRFGEEYRNWTYSKTPFGDVAELRDGGFDYAVSSRSVLPGFVLIKRVEGFDGIGVPRDLESLGSALSATGLPLVFRTSPQVYIHKRQG